MNAELWRRLAWSERLLFAALLLGLLLVCGTGAWWFWQDHNPAHAQHARRGWAPFGRATPDLATFLTALPTVPFEPAAPVAPWDGASPLVMLLLGVDDRPWVANWGPPRSDTLVVLVYDPQQPRLGVLSLPRDLMVDIPGWPAYPQKINMAYPAGFAQGGPHAGARYAAQVVGQLLDMSIPYYAVVNYAAFVQAIDAIGGVKLDVPHPMLLDTYDLATGAYKPVRLKEGRQTLDGALALAYVRFRGDEHGDFGRMARQQQVLWAVYQRLKEPWVWEYLLPRVPSLYQSLRNGVWTNLRPQDVVRLGWQLKDLPSRNIHMAVVDQRQAQARMINGVYVLIPDVQAIRALRDQVLFGRAPSAVGTPPGPTPAAPATPARAVTSPPRPQGPPSPTPDWWAMAQGERARIGIYNGTQTPGLACRTAAYLRQYGFWVVEVGNAPQRYLASTMDVWSSKPATVHLLQLLFQVPDHRLTHWPPRPDATVDVAVYLGEDWAHHNPIPPDVTCDQ